MYVCVRLVLEKAARGVARAWISCQFACFSAPRTFGVAAFLGADVLDAQVISSTEEDAVENHVQSS